MNKKDNNDKKEETEEKKEDNIDHFVENIKAKKNVKIYDKKELDIIRHFEENPNIDDNLLKKEFEEKKGNSHVEKQYIEDLQFVPQ